LLFPRKRLKGLGPEVDPVRDVVLWSTVENRLWQILPKGYAEKVEARLREHLEKNYNRLRGRRHPEDPSYFVVTLYQPEGDNWHTFEFIVDDSTADTCLIVSDVIHTLGKIRIR
jgi:hypothetical protein